MDNDEGHSDDDDIHDTIQTPPRAPNNSPASSSSYTSTSEHAHPNYRLDAPRAESPFPSSPSERRNARDEETSVKVRDEETQRLLDDDCTLDDHDKNTLNDEGNVGRIILIIVGLCVVGLVLYVLLQVTCYTTSATGGFCRPIGEIAFRLFNFGSNQKVTISHRIKYIVLKRSR